MTHSRRSASTLSAEKSGPSSSANHGEPRHSRHDEDRGGSETTSIESLRAMIASDVITTTDNNNTSNDGTGTTTWYLARQQ